MQSWWYRWQHGSIVMLTPGSGTSKQMVQGSASSPVAQVLGSLRSSSSTSLGGTGPVFEAGTELPAGSATRSMSDLDRRNATACDCPLPVPSDVDCWRTWRSAALRCRASTRARSIGQGIDSMWLRSSRIRVWRVQGRAGLRKAGGRLAAGTSEGESDSGNEAAREREVAASPAAGCIEAC
mmetsp:Transcript_110505/g.323266  ORF Transcript_110505/g.323266 Transcript_110505/m.323266 type:complete len:181 (+) Transcript_110505:297-839(+)